MFVATVIVTVLLAALLGFAAIRKLSHRDRVVREYAGLGVPENRLNPLAGILLAGAAGLIAGLAWAPLGIAAAIGLVCYFTAAVIVHIRAHDAKHLPTPLTYAALAVAALVLRLASG
ncbi:DoxX family protein [Rhodococcus maanshanensis]|uniref:DoxX-like family protein n=1 Tax=Rhodococcus maanshanensis TaxID=183556 RepID=A0A1H7KL83_9NOCA|nr:DoxX family protein [Rhodococcus maanshanensis]SEK86755.1 DoxX-like family protein [Rhodococcus maanshanensis]